MRPSLTTAGVPAVGAALWAARHVSAPTVRHWSRSTAPRATAGLLRVRHVGTGASATVLLHGIVGCGDYFGAAYDSLAHDRRLVVPDLLGFGDSYRARSTAGYGLDAHLDALDEMATARQLSGALTVVGHSMGAVLALHWAARRRTQVERVIALSAPLYLSTEEGLSRVRDMGLLEAAMALDTPLARATCGWMCRHRATASWVATALKPHLPVTVARRGVLHTWPAYLAAMQDIVLGSPWPAALSALTEAGIPILFAAGGRDPVPVPGRIDGLVADHPTVSSATHPTAGHDLPLAQPAWCRALIDRDTDRVGPAPAAG